MRPISYFAGVLGIAFVSLIFNITHTTFASGSKEAHETGNATVQCLLCNKTIAKNKSIKVDHEGKTFHFCSEDCVAKFKNEPGECRREEKYSH